MQRFDNANLNMKYSSLKKANMRLLILSVIFILVPLKSALSFCGFYVAKADSSLYNKASQVVMVRNEDKTVISMMNDYQGKLKEFAMVVPIPEVLEKGQINVGDRKLFSRIDAFTAPRLVEYFDPDPCQEIYRREMMLDSAPMMKGASSVKRSMKAKKYGVKVEAEYTVGEYDIVILSAKESGGLESWLIDNNYKIPEGARSVLKPYIKQKMKFFVAKVNLKEQIKTGLEFLRPLQFAFNSEKFMLPIRLGMINSDGEQELLVYILTKEGRVETTNYRTAKIPSGMELPTYVKSDFKEFYTDMFETQVKKEGMKTVFLEYFWDMGWCDPCAADPLSPDELKKLGVFWLKDTAQYKKMRPRPRPGQGIVPGPRPGGFPRAQNVKVTRLHVKYNKKNFPEDLMFQETQDKKNFQGRYVLRHPWKGERNECKAAENYFDQLQKRQSKEAQNLASLTNWDINDIRDKMKIGKSKSSDNGSSSNPKEEKKKSWWKNLWD